MTETLDDKSERRIAWLVERLRRELVRGLATTKRFEVRLVAIGQDRKLTRESRVELAPEHPPE